MVKKNISHQYFNLILLLFFLLLIIISYFYFYKKIFLKEKFNNRNKKDIINNQDKNNFNIPYQMGSGNTKSEGKIKFDIPFNESPYVFIQPMISDKDMVLINTKDINTLGFSYEKNKMIKDPSGLTGIKEDDKSNFQWIAFNSL